MTTKTEAVETLPQSSTWTPEQAIAAAAKQELDELVVIGYKKNGNLIVYNSRTTNERLLYMAEMLREVVLGRV